MRCKTKRKVHNNRQLTRRSTIGWKIAPLTANCTDHCDTAVSPHRIELYVNMSHEPWAQKHSESSKRISHKRWWWKKAMKIVATMAQLHLHLTMKPTVCWFIKNIRHSTKRVHLRLGPKRGWSVKGNSFQLSLVVSNIKRFYCCGVDCFLNQQWSQPSDKGWSNSIVASLWWSSAENWAGKRLQRGSKDISGPNKVLIFWRWFVSWLIDVKPFVIWHLSQ